MLSFACKRLFSAVTSSAASSGTSNFTRTFVRKGHRVSVILRERLDNLRQTMSATVQEIRQLETLKNRFMEVATPTNLRDKYSKKDDARGGPWLPPRFQNNPSRDLNQDFAFSLVQPLPLLNK